MPTITDRRTETHPVWSYKIDQLSWASGSSAAQAVQLHINGIVRGFMVTVSDNTNDVTVTVAFRDADDKTIVSHAAIAENASTLKEDNVWLDGNCDLVVTPSGVPGASGLTVDVRLFGE